MGDHAPILTETTGSRPPRQPADSLKEAAPNGREDLRDRVNRSNMIIEVRAVCAVPGALALLTQQVWSIVDGEVFEIHSPILDRILHSAQIMLFIVAVVGLYLRGRKDLNTFSQLMGRSNPGLKCTFAPSSRLSREDSADGRESTATNGTHAPGSGPAPRAAPKCSRRISADARARPPSRDHPRSRPTEKPNDSFPMARAWPLKPTLSTALVPTSSRDWSF
jgi:hypothetical protein